jgi:ketosteroid isomerase-like protein
MLRRMTPLELMGKYVEAMRSGDRETAYAYFAEDVLLHIPGRSSLAGERRGRDQAIGYIKSALARAHGAKVELEVIDVLASAERVALMVRERFHRESGTVEIRRTNVYRIASDKIAEIWIFEADQYAVDELLGP